MTEQLSRPQPGYEEEFRFADTLLESEQAQPVPAPSVERARFLWQRRRFLCRIAGAGLLIAAVTAFSIPKRYMSTARLMPPDQGPGNGLAMMTGLASAAVGGSLGSLGNQLLGLKSTGDLFVGILQSRTVQEDLVNKFNLKTEYRTGNTEDALDALSQRTDVSEDRKSEIITIQVTDRNPRRAQEMTAEYVEALNRVVTNLNTSAAHRERVFLEARLDQVQQDLESAEKDFSQFASKNTAIDIQAQDAAMIDAGASLEGQLIAAQTELQGLRQIYADENVHVRATQARIDELNRQLQKLSGKNTSATADAQQDASSLYPTIRQLPVLGVTYADLYRRTKVQEAVFETLTQEYELAKVEEVKETPSVKVLDPPNLPEKKSYPPRLAITFLGAALAFTTAAMWLLARRAWDAIETRDPRKAFVSEMWTDITARFPWISVAAGNAHRNSSGTDSRNDGRDDGRNGSRNGAHASPVAHPNHGDSSFD
jgi:uncharacterized protein involved in exopolysaccharide biosynthesis